MSQSKNPNRVPSAPLAQLVMEMEMAPLKQGIVAILGEERKDNAASIRRTLSADMSSKNWLQLNGFGFTHLKNKRISSPDSSASSSSCESEEEWSRIPCQDDVWRNIQNQKEENQTWGSLILTHAKSDDSSQLLLPPPPPAYVHPLIKRSSSVMSDESLEICTESLGSEAGSDSCFSCYSFPGILNGDEKRKRVTGEKNKKNCSSQVAKYKKLAAQEFPPPLPSISGGDGTALHMNSRRENGRLVVEAVAEPPRNQFMAQRRDGRLVLSLARAPPPEDMDEDETVDGRLQEMKGGAANLVVGKNLRSLPPPSGMISVHKLVVKKLVTIGNKNPKLTTESDDLIIQQSIIPPPPRLIPPLPSPPASSPFNPYEYFWRSKTSPLPITAATTTLKKTRTSHNNENQDMIFMKGNKGEYLLPYFRGCKETRRTILFWEPCCIATS